MTVISKITTQKKNTSRYNIFINDEYAFSVDEAVFIKFQLKKGKTLSPLDIQQIQFHDTIEKAYTMALHFLSYRMRSELEVRQYLIGKNIELIVINEIIHKLYHHNYLNDLDFAKAFVRTQMSSGEKGPRIIQISLKEKGIREPYIEEAMDEFPHSMQIEQAERLAKKMVKKENKLSERALKQKLEAMLHRKGFMSDVVAEVVSNLTIEKDEEEEWTAIVHQGEKIKKKYEGKEPFIFQQKIKQALYRKGFPLELIERYLAELENVND